MSKLVEQLKEYLENTPKDVLKNEYEEINRNCVGPTVEEWLEHNKLR